jgi:hypothetical protein
VVFVYVCLEVVDFSMMFACWDSIEPIRYGVCDVYVGCGDWFATCESFVASWCEISLPEIPMCALTFCIVMLCLVNLVDYG